MNSFYVYAAFVLACFVATSEAIFDGGVVSVPAGALILGALGVKAIAGIGLLAKSRKGGRRSKYGKRSVEDISTILAEAQLDDESDCAKKMVCEVHAKAVSALDATEAAVYQLFGEREVIDVSKETVQFDLAAMVGARGGAKQCHRVYKRCTMGSAQLLAALRN